MQPKIRWEYILKPLPNEGKERLENWRNRTLDEITEKLKEQGVRVK